MEGSVLHWTDATGAKCDADSSMPRAANKPTQDTDESNERGHITAPETALDDQSANNRGDVVEYAKADGKQAWIIVFTAFCNLTVTMGTLNSFGVYQELYLNKLYTHESAVGIAWISTLISFCMFGGAIFTGSVIDKIGFSATCIIGAITCGAALVLASFTSQLWQLVLTQGIMLGCGASLIFSPSMAIVAQWHTKHRILATGIAVSGGGVGGMAISAATQALVEHVGYAWSLRTLGILIAFVGVSASLTYKRRISPPKESNIQLLAMLLTDIRFMCIAMAVLFINMGYFEPLLYVPTSVVSHGGSTVAASNVVLVFNAGTTVGRILSGLIAEYLGPVNANLVSSLVSCIWVGTFLLGVNSIPGYYVFSMLFGATSTVYLAVNTHILAKEFGPHVLATSVGLSMACCGVGVLIGNPTQGALYEEYDRPRGRFVAVSAWATACFGAAAASYLLLRVIVVKKHRIPSFSKM